MKTFLLLITCIGGLVTGIGVSLRIFTHLLDKSNNMGDSTSGFMHYSNGDIKYTRKWDDVGCDDRYYFLATYGNPKEKEKFVEESRLNAKSDRDGIPPGMPTYKPDL